jgi:protein SCO1/2
MPKNRRRWLALLATIALSVTMLAWMQRHNGVRSDDWATASPELQTVLWPMSHPVAPFHMHDQHGAVFSTEQLHGQWNFLFFGYLQCPDVCPTTLQSLAQFRRLLLAGDPAANRYRFVFVTVDPAHDDSARMSGYLAYFDPEFVGLTGDPEQLATLARSLGVAYAEHIDAQGVRSMDHSTSVVLVDPDGQVVGALPAPHDPARMLRFFRQLQTHRGGG